MYANFIIGLKSDYALCSGKHALKCRKACTKTPCSVHYIIGIYSFKIIWKKSVRWQEYLESRLEVEKQLNYVENCMILENTVKVLKVFWRENIPTLIMHLAELHFCIA